MWWRPLSFSAILLSPFALLYGFISGLQMSRKERYRSSVPVICVGNFVVGGAGKTPTALAIAARLKREDSKVCFLTRGYGGRLSGPLWVDPETHTAADVGDEALLLAELAPTIISGDRVAGAKAAEAEGMDWIVMDDGLQNPALHKSLRLAVADGFRGIGNGLCIPAGPLRAPLARQFHRTDAVVVVGQGGPGFDFARLAARRGLPVLRGRLEPSGEALSEIVGGTVLAYAGIGNPDKFFATLSDFGIAIGEGRSFADHHVYTEDDARQLLQDAETANQVLVTTSKDRARLPDDDTALGDLKRASKVLDVTLELENPDLLERLIATARDRHVNGQ